jgi:hypothetical protein
MEDWLEAFKVVNDLPALPATSSDLARPFLEVIQLFLQLSILTV